MRAIQRLRRVRPASIVSALIIAAGFTVISAAIACRGPLEDRPAAPGTSSLTVMQGTSGTAGSDAVNPGDMILMPEFTPADGNGTPDGE